MPRRALTGRLGNGSYIQDGNAKTIEPGGDAIAAAQTAYDWLKSAERDAAMGAVSASNPRYLVRQPGAYAEDITADTDYVYIVDAVPGTVIDSGSHTITANINPFVDLGKNAPRLSISQNRPNFTGAIRYLCDDATDFAAVTVNGQPSVTLADDTDNWRISANAAGSSVKITINPSLSGASYGYAKPDSPANAAEVNFSGTDNILLRFYIDPDEVDYIDNIKILLYEDIVAGSSIAFYTLWEDFDGNGRQTGMSGWNEWHGNMYSHNNSIDPAGFDYSSVELIYIQIFTKGNLMTFTNGSGTEPVAGETLTGRSSTKTAVVESVDVTSGSFAGGDAAGTFTVKTISGAFTADEITDASGGATFNFGATTYRTPSISLDEMSFFAKATTPYTILRFDDGYDEHYAAAAYLKSKGLRGCFGVIGSLVGNTGFLTLAQLKAIQDMGHLLVNHSWTADDVADITPAQMDYYIRKNAQWMEDNGLGRGARIFIYPEGLWTDENEALTKDYLDLQWASFRTPGYYAITQIHNSKLSGLLADSTAATLSLYGYNCRSTGTGSGTLANCLASVITEGGVYIPYFHQFDEAGTITFANLKTHIDAIAADVDAGNINNISPIDLYSGNL